MYVCASVLILQGEKKNTEVYQELRTRLSQLLAAFLIWKKFVSVHSPSPPAIRPNINTYKVKCDSCVLEAPAVFSTAS
jgi:hypothetical protein